MERAFKSKRGKQLSSIGKKRGRPAGWRKETASKRQKEVPGANLPPRSKHTEIRYGDMGCRTHIVEDGHRFTVGPLDGLPFLSSFSSQSGASKALSRSEKFLLQQLELFTLHPKLAEKEKMNAPPESVAMRCRNCIADKNGCCFMRLSSVDNLPRDLLLMAVEHLACCRFMKVKEVKVIQELKEGGSDRSALTKYCKWMARLYSMENYASGGSGGPRGVVWGDSPKVPAGGYCSPADVKVDLLLGGDAPMPHLEAESLSSANRVAEKEVVAEAGTTKPVGAVAENRNNII